MGRCTSNQSSEKQEEEYTKSSARPFFRKECPSLERVTHEDLSENLPTEIKETVLQNVRGDKSEEYTEDFNTKPYSDQTVDTRYIDEDDHYDLITENEMLLTNFAETGGGSMPVYCTLPLLKPSKQDSKYIRRSTTPADSVISREEARSRCLEYSEMVSIFKPLIVQNLLVQDILPFLPFLEKHDDIYKEMKSNSPKCAAESLLDELERSEELGKWQNFIDALSASGYTYIVDNIRGGKFISHKYQREYIRKLTPKIGKMIVARDLLPHLLAKDLISYSDKEDIQRVDANRGNYAAAVLLLDRIHRMHRNWYIVFIKTLLDANMNEVAADLQIPELLESQRTKETYVCMDKDQNKNPQSVDKVYADIEHKDETIRTHYLKKDKRRPGRSLPPPPKCSPGHMLPPRLPSADNTNRTQNKSAISTDDSIPEEDARSRCMEYSEMVNIFKPLIVQNLLVQDILPSLPFLDNHDDIYAEMRNHSPKNAVVSLLDELQRSEEVGKWQKFIDALEANGYTYIVDNIRGYKFINHRYQREYIKKLTPKIGKMIMTKELLLHLLAKDLISDSDNENIQREDTNHGNFAAAVLLLDRIHRKHRNWYLLFIEALTEADMEDVAVDLRIPELLKSRRTKVTVVQNPDKDNDDVPDEDKILVNKTPRQSLDFGHSSNLRVRFPYQQLVRVVDLLYPVQDIYAFRVIFHSFCGYFCSG